MFSDYVLEPTSAPMENHTNSPNMDATKNLVGHTVFVEPNVKTSSTNTTILVMK